MIAISARTVLICQNKTCRKQQSEAVFAAFQACSLPEAIALESGCLGECGNGPMVLVLPDQIWYWRVHPEEVPAIVEQHLCQGRPVRAMLYPKFHARDI